MDPREPVPGSSCVTRATVSPCQLGMHATQATHLLRSPPAATGVPLGRVDRGARAGGLLPPWASCARQPYSVRRDTPKASRVAANPWRCQNARIYKRCAAVLAIMLKSQGTIGYPTKALYSISDLLNLHSSPSNEERKLLLASVRPRDQLGSVFIRLSGK
jgi:hypothetical protein